MQNLQYPIRNPWVIYLGCTQLAQCLPKGRVVPSLLALTVGFTFGVTLVQPRLWSAFPCSLPFHWGLTQLNVWHSCTHSLWTCYVCSGVKMPSGPFYRSFRVLSPEYDCLHIQTAKLYDVPIYIRCLEALCAGYLVDRPFAFDGQFALTKK